MSSPRIEKSFCTTREAANQLGVSVGTVQLWVESGLLQAWKTAGGHRRVLRDSVERLLRKADPQDASDWGALPAEPVSAPRLRVMVVEDEATQLRLYQITLGSWPMPLELQLVDNAFAALMMMGRGCPDLLITDLDMEGVDGFALLRALQKMPEAAPMRTVVVSALTPAAIAARGGVPGGIETLSKPAPFERLLAIATEVATALRVPLPPVPPAPAAGAG